MSLQLVGTAASVKKKSFIVFLPGASLRDRRGHQLRVEVSGRAGWCLVREGSLRGHGGRQAVANAQKSDQIFDLKLYIKISTCANSLTS